MSVKLRKGAQDARLRAEIIIVYAEANQATTLLRKGCRVTLAPTLLIRCLSTRCTTSLGCT
jgi:hypothetical protein